ncbi:cation:proton antiporter [uncultured Bradyrhizobium sp.]|uniref:cation:proton antiporter n=1 Tax=uncultured Bradyrhizobium sp. TaxID=199684 RepID=UPI0035CC5B86
MTEAFLFVVQALVIVVLPYAVWHFTRLGRVVPLVVVQIMTGVALGPSLLGKFAPDAYQLLFSPDRLRGFSGISSIAVLTFGFITGLHLDSSHYRHRGFGFGLTAIGSMAVPLGLGAMTGVWILERFPNELPAAGSRYQFIVAIAICIGITALPVLAAILREMKLLRDSLGQTALGLAAVNDGALWILLAALLTSTGAAGVLPVTQIVPIFLAYLFVMFFVVRPMTRRFIKLDPTDGGLSDGNLVGVIAVAFVSGAATETIGLHYILGAFIAGAAMPNGLRRAILDKLEIPVVVLLMPFFFMLAGLRAMIDVGSPAFQQIAAGAFAAAIIGKVIGTALPARLMHSWPESLALGTLMTTKGLMELIVLTILLDAGIISGNVFSALLSMALVVTAVVTPLTHAILRHRDKKLNAPELARPSRVTSREPSQRTDNRKQGELVQLRTVNRKGGK